MKKILSLLILIISIGFIILPKEAHAVTYTYCCPNNAATIEKECHVIDLNINVPLIRPAKQCSGDETCDRVSGLCVSPTGSIGSIIGRVEPPPEIGSIGFGAEGISNIINKIVQIIYAVAGVIFVFMIIISALQWIMSGGEKEAVSKAKGRLTWAVIGIVVLSLAFVIMSVLGQITGFTFFAGQ